MNRRTRLRLPSHATVVAYMSLFIALGGVSYAAVELKKSSVRSKHIKNGQVKTADLARDAVKGSKVADGTLTAADFKSGELLAGPRGEKGEPGPQGVSGAKGEVGPTGPTGTVDTSSFYTKAESNEQFVEGRSTIVANRVVVPGNASGSYKFLDVPGLGFLTYYCGSTSGHVVWHSNIDLDMWTQVNGAVQAEFKDAGPAEPSSEMVAADDTASDTFDGSTFSVGKGSAPGERTIATVHAYARQSANSGPCTFQAQATISTIPAE